jgi:hypothetical protein
MFIYRKESKIMNKKLIALFSLIIILAFIGYIIYDASNETGKEEGSVTVQKTVYNDNWKIERTYHITDGTLTSVAVSSDGMILLGGDSFIKSLDTDLISRWSFKTDMKITSIAISGDTIFASTPETILLISTKGELITEWGPYESNSIITSVSAGKKLVVFSDAGNKRVFVLKKNGELNSMMGQSEEKFVIPSSYFDVALSDAQLFIANTGYHRIETWTTNGKKMSSFGQPGTASGAFCGCCNPAHFAVIPQGFITAEKGINRIKILGPEGNFIEFVSSKNNFVPSVPLDVASVDGIKIYAVNPVDSSLYIFIRN